MKKVVKFILFIVLITSLSASMFLLWSCADDKEPEIKLVEEDIVFRGMSSTLKSNPYACFAWGIPLSVVFGNIEIGLNKDGTGYIELALREGMMSILPTLGIDIGTMAGDLNISALMDEYALDYLPGLNLDDLQASLELIRKSIGLSIVGFDFESSNMIALQDSLRETGTLPEGFQIPDGLKFVYNCKYKLVDVYSPATDSYMTAVYMYNIETVGEPVIVLTLEEHYNNPEKQQVSLYVDFIKLSLYAFEV